MLQQALEFLDVFVWKHDHHNPVGEGHKEGPSGPSTRLEQWPFQWPDDAVLANNINFYWGGKGSIKMGDIVLENDYPNSNLLRPLTDEAQGTLARKMLNLSDYSVK
jgi:hypothetical protein